MRCFFMSWRRSLDHLERVFIALTASFGAWILSPETIRTLCLLRSTLMEQLLTGALATAAIIAALRLCRRWQRWLLIPAAPALALGLTLLYLEWLHSDHFPEPLIDPDIRKVLALWKIEENQPEPWLHTTGPITASSVTKSEDDRMIEIELTDDGGQSLILYLDRRLRGPLSPTSYALFPSDPSSFNLPPSTFPSSLWVDASPKTPGTILLPPDAKTRTLEILDYLGRAEARYLPGYVDPETWSVEKHLALREALSMVGATV